MTSTGGINLDTLHLDVMLLGSKGYCCSQIMTILMLGRRGEENSSLVRAMAGLCNGIGYSGDICGALSGGVCLLSLCAGKGSDGEAQHERLPLMFFELTEWFRERTEGPFGGMKCDSILTRSPDKRACAVLVSETYEKVLSILESHDVPPYRREM
ncbi:MAG: DVU_1555 family C-GCAxxG-C-C protein [Syntrophorhabdales bacterium]|jgi:C_GCAxxG_C_C family probable redox protein